VDVNKKSGASSGKDESRGSRGNYRMVQFMGFLLVFKVNKRRFPFRLKAAHLFSNPYRTSSYSLKF